MSHGYGISPGLEKSVILIQNRYQADNAYQQNLNGG